ncbi:MAG: hypothetical protein QOC71_802 [Thermoplasmata archaeon]|nr:hypothetical protein [Thermoplasmata archaeon]
MSNHVDAAFTQKHLQDGKTKVINVLAKDRYAQGHLPGSINIPEDAPDFADQVRQAVPDLSTPVITHCSSMECQASTKAARKIEALGYKEVYDFKAGLQGWQDAGNAFESGTVATPAQAGSPEAEHAGSERPPRPGREQAARHEEARKPETPPL